MSQAAEVAVAVVSWNTRALLERCLDSLAAEAGAEPIEVWVVDNASTDGSAKMVAETYPWAHLIAADENLGFGAAVNLVAARTRSRWIVPANADVELLPGALEALLAAAQAAPRIGAVAPRLLLDDGATQHSVHRFPTLPATALFNLGVQRVVPRLGDALCLEGYWDPERAREVDWALGAFLLVRRAAWDAAGGFDPQQWMYAEDLDLGWRLARAGWRTLYVPEARVRHRGAAATERRWGAARRARWLEATYAWMVRRRGRARTACYALLSVAGASARWLVLRLLAIARPARFATSHAQMAAWARLHLAAFRSASKARSPQLSGPLKP